MIALIDVLLNTPENVYRLLILLGIIEAGIPTDYGIAAQMIAQVKETMPLSADHYFSDI